MPAHRPGMPHRGATVKIGSMYPQVEEPHQSMGVHIPNPRRQSKAWESKCPTRLGQSVELHISNSRGHAKAWNSVFIAQRATPKQWNP